MISTKDPSFGLSAFEYIAALQIDEFLENGVFPNTGVGSFEQSAGHAIVIVESLFNKSKLTSVELHAATILLLS